MARFDVGDRVFMRVGGPRMTVKACLENSIYLCEWYDKQRELHSVEISEGGLITPAERLEKFVKGYSRVVHELAVIRFR